MTRIGVTMISGLNLLAWFLLTNSLVFASQWWFPLSYSMRIFSLSTLFLSTALLVLNYSVSNLFRLLLTKPALPIENIHSDWLPMGKIEREKLRSLENIPLTLLLGLVYASCTAIACRNFEEVNQLYLYVTGWAVYCVFLDLQVQMRLRDITLAELIREKTRVETSHETSSETVAEQSNQTKSEEKVSQKEDDVEEENSLEVSSEDKPEGEKMPEASSEDTGVESDEEQLEPSSKDSAEDNLDEPDTNEEEAQDSKGLEEDSENKAA